METVSCKVCGSSYTEYLISTVDKLFPTKGKYNIVRCGECGLIYTNPRPTQEELKTLYPQEYWGLIGGKGDNHNSKILVKVEEAYRKYLLSLEVKVIKKLLKPNGKILDVGCGNGSILSLCKKQGFRTFGVELSPDAIKNVRNSHGLDIICGDIFEAGYNSNFFDVVTLYHVLEHLHEPLRTLKEIRRILKDQGFLVIQVPNIDSLQFKMFREKWFPIDTPRHLYHFSPKTINDFLNKAKLAVISINHFSIRCNSVAFVSSLIPRWNPHTLLLNTESKGKSKAIAKILYLILTILLIPWTLIESMFGHGAIITIIAGKKEKP